jgi:hypothetical protein
MIVIPPHGVQKHLGYLWDRCETDYNPGSVFGPSLYDCGKQLPWHCLASWTQKVQLELLSAATGWSRCSSVVLVASLTTSPLYMVLPANFPSRTL